MSSRTAISYFEFTPSHNRLTKLHSSPPDPTFPYHHDHNLLLRPAIYKVLPQHMKKLTFKHTLPLYRLLSRNYLWITATVIKTRVLSEVRRSFNRSIEEPTGISRGSSGILVSYEPDEQGGQ